MEFWKHRLKEQGVTTGASFERFGFPVLPFEDPDGLSLELVFEDLENALESSREGKVPAEHAIRGFWGTTLKLTEAESTAEILQDILGFERADEQENITRYTTDAPIGGSVLIELSDKEEGRNGRGTIHHVAFRAADKEMLNNLRYEVLKKGLHATEIIDRHGFKSVYYRIPADVLFEMASDGPGYTVDEDSEHLGELLILPPWLESKREQIENQLPELTI